jgi:hypothetical protein
MTDYFDLMVVFGVLLLGLAVWLLAGWPGVLGYIGTLLIVVGVALAWRAGRVRARQ